LLARLEESEPAVGAHVLRLRDKREGFRTWLQITGPIENIMSNSGWWPIVLDCVDFTDILVGHQNLTAVLVGAGPEA
jgi:hypothetical protein